MTRLLPRDLAGFDKWAEYESRLMKLTGQNLMGLAADTLDVPVSTALSLLAEQKVAIIPQSGGAGVIAGFVEALAEIVTHLGAKAFITVQDEEGFDQARQMGATLTLTSDDDLFIATRLATGRTSENGQATGRGFAQALMLMAGPPTPDEPVLVAGCGQVGLSGARLLSRRGYHLILCDIDPSRSQIAAQLTGGQIWEQKLGPLPSGCRLILEATTTDFIFPQKDLLSNSVISAPGIPLSFQATPGLKFHHDTLQTGTAVMLLEASL